MLNILILVTKAEIGGAQMSVLNLAEELKKQGHNVTVAFGKGNFLSEELKPLNIPYYRFKKLVRTHNPFKNLLFLFEFKNYLKLNNFDIIHINSSNALTAGFGAKLSPLSPFRGERIKTVFTFRGMSLLDSNYKKNKFLKIIYRAYFKFFLNFIDKKIFVSKFNYDFALKEKIIKKGNVVYNGLNKEKLKFYDKKKVKNLLENHLQTDLGDKFIIGSIGRHCYAKNYEFLINIFQDILKINPFAVCVIIGGFGEETDKYKKLIKKLNLKNKVFLTGEINNASKFISAFDLFTLVSRYEGMPITLIESLFAGLPILASRVGGIPEMLNNDERQLFELNNKNDFLKKFITLSQEEKIIKGIKKNNRELAEKYDIKNTVEGYLDVYRS
ncbi:glycosyltransferase [Candidatus Parcubacteria bacterium]|nr:glycosyltransferase [Candidatus Parcubacteria bacterium]